jgi:hypothetical protein
VSNTLSVRCEFWWNESSNPLRGRVSKQFDSRADILSDVIAVLPLGFSQDAGFKIRRLDVRRCDTRPSPKGSIAERSCSIQSYSIPIFGVIFSIAKSYMVIVNPT